MKSLKRTKQASKLKVAHRITLVKKDSGKNLTNDLKDKNVLKRAIEHLRKQINTKRKQLAKENCLVEDLDEGRIDEQVKLRCRQLPNVVKELRKALMKQDWDDATTLVMILCHPGLKYYSSIILKVCFILLLSHPDSNIDFLHYFIRLTTEYVLPEDVDKFMKILFALRKSALSPLGRGKFIRKTGDYKVVRDPEFEML